MRQKLGEEGCRWTHQVAVPRLSRVAFQSLLPQGLRQQRNHSMVAGEEGGGGPRRWGWAGESRGGRKWEGKGERKRRGGRATPVCTSDCLGPASKNGRGVGGGQGLSLLLHLTTSGPGSPAHSHKHMVSQLLPQATYLERKHSITRLNKPLFSIQQLGRTCPGLGLGLGLGFSETEPRA